MFGNKEVLKTYVTTEHEEIVALQHVASPAIETLLMEPLLALAAL